MTEGRKDDTGKRRWQLLRKGCVHALEAVIKVLEYGAKKYGDENWKLVEQAEVRYRDALDRHLADLDKGIIYDPDTGEHQYAHVATNALFLLELHEASKPRPVSNDVDDEPWPVGSNNFPAKKKGRRVEEPWRRHTPGKRPGDSRGLARIEYKILASDDEVHYGHPGELLWNDVGLGTITYWRPKIV